MQKKVTYANIDMVETGQKLKNIICLAGYNPKDIQKYLHLSCVQPIYRWYKGKILPSVDNLFMLSELLGVHMEELLVKKMRNVMVYDIEKCSHQKMEECYKAYAEGIYGSVA